MTTRNILHRALTQSLCLSGSRRMPAATRTMSLGGIIPTSGMPMSSRSYHLTTSVSDDTSKTAWKAGPWSDADPSPQQDRKPGSIAFAACEVDAIVDLFYHHAQNISVNGKLVKMLAPHGVEELLKSIGERSSDITIRNIFKQADRDGNGYIDLDEFLMCADTILGDAPARIVLVVGGPGSGKGILSKRLEQECNVVHLSSGDLLRCEVERDTPLGREVAGIMQRGELVSSAIIVTLVRRRMRDHPGKRVLLDGFPRSLENAHDLVELCGKPELALHLDADDTILMERIIGRGKDGQRKDDNFDTALHRLRTYHKYHLKTMDWLRDQKVPVVNLDCTGSPDDVWNQLTAIGRLMRPALRQYGSKVDPDVLGGIGVPGTTTDEDEPRAGSAN